MLLMLACSSIPQCPALVTSTLPQLGASKEPQHRRLQDEEEPAGDEEPALSEDKQAGDGAPPDALADWVEPDLGTAGRAG